MLGPASSYVLVRSLSLPPVLNVHSSNLADPKVFQSGQSRETSEVVPSFVYVEQVWAAAMGCAVTV